MSKVTIHTYHKFPIKIDEKELRRLHNEIESYVKDGTIIYTIKYSNKVSVSDATLEEVLKDENTKKKNIQGLSIEAHDKENHISLEFQEAYIHQNAKIKLYISGSDKRTVLDIQSHIEDRFDNIKENYFKVSTITWLTVVPVYLIVSYISVFYLSKLLKPYFTNMTPILEILLMAFNIGIGLLSFYAIYKLFPSLSFLIGYGINRYNTVVERRKNLFWVVVVGLILTFFGTIIQILIN